MARAYYNEIDPYAAQWLRNLIAAGLIAEGDVDERSIVDVRPGDLRSYTQCHFFAGIGVWSYALRQAGWGDDRPVWTGSCPCQPFSVAGRGAGFADERHLWPHWHHLIAQCRPPVVFGEQVASKDGLAWLDLVQADLEGTGYALGAVDICAAGVGAPHIRQRLYWVANAEGAGRETWGRDRVRDARAASRSSSTAHGCSVSLLGDAVGARLEGAVGGLADATEFGRREECSDVGRGAVGNSAEGLAAGLVAGGRDLRPSPTNGFWRDADWLYCRDGKWRPVEPGTFPLADGTPARVGRLRAYGNAIVAQAAATVIGAYLDICAVRQGEPATDFNQCAPVTGRTSHHQNGPPSEMMTK